MTNFHGTTTTTPPSYPPSPTKTSPPTVIVAGHFLPSMSSTPESKSKGKQHLLIYLSQFKSYSHVIPLIMAVWVANPPLHSNGSPSIISPTPAVTHMKLKAIPPAHNVPPLKNANHAQTESVNQSQIPRYTQSINMELFQGNQTWWSKFKHSGPSPVEFPALTWRTMCQAQSWSLMAVRKLIILSLFLDGAPQIKIKHIGMLGTHGDQIGEILEISK